MADGVGFSRCSPYRAAGDEAGALWLEHEATGLGAELATEVFELNRLDPIACYLELEDERISAMPAFDAPPTDANGVTGTPSLSGHDEAILVAKLAPRSILENTTGFAAIPLTGLW